LAPKATEFGEITQNKGGCFKAKYGSAASPEEFSIIRTDTELKNGRVADNMQKQT